MAHTEVFLSNDSGTVIPSLPSVAVISGDTIAFSVTGGEPVYAFFSPAATSAVSPKPPSPLPLSSKSPTVFTFTTSAAGAYSAFFENGPSASVLDFPGGESNLLLLEIDIGDPGFAGPIDSTKKGQSTKSSLK